MKVAAALLLCLGIAGISGQPVPEKPANASGAEQIASELQASKIVESGVAATALSYGRVPSNERSYEPASYSPYPSSNCQGYAHGYYGNPNHGCRIFHVCQEDGRLETFDCPPFTKFNNFLLVCDWPHNVDYNCDPVYKSEEYPTQSRNNAYPTDRSYAPSFMNLYPMPKPAYTPVPYYPENVYPVQPAYPSVYGPINSYGPKPYGHYKPSKHSVYEKSYDVYADKPSVYEKTYNSYEKPVLPVYEKAYPVHPDEKFFHKIHSKKVYGDQTYDYAEKPKYAPVYQTAKIEYTKPAYEVYPKDSYANKPHSLDAPKYPHSEKVDYYPAPKPMYEAYPEKYVVDKAYAEKPKYPVQEKVEYPVQVPSYEAYPEKQYAEKPMYSPMYPLRQPEYPVQKHESYPAEKYYDRPAKMEHKYNVYPVGHPSYVPEKPSYDVYPLDKPAYKSPAYKAPFSYGPYKLDKTVQYKQINYDAPNEQPIYIPPKPVHSNEYPVPKPSYAEKAYPAAPVYPVEEPAYKPSVYEKVPAIIKAEYGYSEKKPEYGAYPEKPYERVPPMNKPEYAAYPEKPAYEKSYPVNKPEYGPYPEKSYVLPLFPYNTYAAERPSYDAYADKKYDAYADRKYVSYNQEKLYGYEKPEKYPTVASYAAYLKNSMEYNRYEPQYGISPVPYVSYRHRLPSPVKSY